MTLAELMRIEARANWDRMAEGFATAPPALDTAGGTFFGEIETTESGDQLIWSGYAAPEQLSQYLDCWTDNGLTDYALALEEKIAERWERKRKAPRRARWHRVRIMQTGRSS